MLYTPQAPVLDLRGQNIFSTLDLRDAFHWLHLCPTEGVKLSYKSYKILYFWNCPIKSYIFSKCPINHIFSTKTAIFVSSFKHFQGMGYVSQFYVRGMASLHLMYHPVHAE